MSVCVCFTAYIIFRSIVWPFPHVSYVPNVSDFHFHCISHLVFANELNFYIVLHLKWSHLFSGWGLETHLRLLSVVRLPCAPFLFPSLALFWCANHFLWYYFYEAKIIIFIVYTLTSPRPLKFMHIICVICFRNRSIQWFGYISYYGTSLSFLYPRCVCVCVLHHEFAAQWKMALLAVILCSFFSHSTKSSLRIFSVCELLTLHFISLIWFWYFFHCFIRLLAFYDLKAVILII